jgi:hypothetical protein
MKRKGIENKQSEAKQAKSPQITGNLQEKDLQLDDREKDLIQGLFSWSKQSRETNWVLGQPV